MKATCLTAALIGCALLTAQPASAEVIGVEQFDYPDGALAAKNGGTFWDYKNVAPVGHTGPASTWDAVTGTPAVTGGRFVTSGTGAKREYNGTLENDGAVNDANVAKTVYFRVTVTTGPTVGSGDFFGISSYDFGVEKIYFGKRGGSTTWGVEEVGVGGTDGSLTIQPNTTYLLVAQLDFPGDGIRLWVNPDLTAAQNATVNINAQTANRSYTGTNWSTAVRLASSGAVTWDDLVVATNWEDLGTVVTTLADEDNGSLDPAAGGGTGISLREAVKYSPTGTLITFAPGLSGQTITLTHPEGDMLIPPAVTIDATALPGGLTVDGNNTSRHFNVESGKSLTLRGLMLTRGNGSDSAGGSIINSGTLTLERCTLAENTSTFEGGAIGSTGTLRAADCTISENTAAGIGGGVFVNSGTAELSRCTLSGNTARHTGGLWQQGTPSVTLTHCTLAGNRSTGVGSVAGVVALGGILNLLHCTISQNTGNGSGGGLYLQDSATVNVNFCIIAGNTDPGSSAPDIFYNGGTLNATGNCIIGNNTSAETQFPAGTFVGTAAAPKEPKLSPLGWFGGPVQTMHPLTGSLAIEGAGAVDIGGTDARGFPRFVDGDLNGTTARDIGAVEAGLPFRVENAGDAGGNTLRLMLTTAGFATNPGARITFDPAVFPASAITLGGTQLTPPPGKSLFIDASNLTGPVTISGNNTSRVFNIPATATVAMHSVRIVGGKAADGTNGGNFVPGGNGDDGGGILNAGSLSLFSCCLQNNRCGNGGNVTFGANGGNGGSGGGIFSTGSLSLTACTLSGNASGNGGDTPQSSVAGNGGGGGGIFSTGTLSLTACTLSSNASGNGGNVIANGTGGNGGGGGGVLSTGSLSFTACTLSGNASGNGGSGGSFGNNGSGGTGGGINAASAILQQCLIARNTQGSSTTLDEVKAGTLTYLDTNLLGIGASVTSSTGPPPIINANPLLAPLGDYGGPTQTMPPRRGSPALDAAGPVAEVQTITVSPPVNFTLSFKGATTGAITGDPPTASAVQNALSALPSIGAGNVQVTSAAGGGLSTVFTVTFTGSLGGVNQPAITGAGSSVGVATVQDGNPGNVFLTDQRGFPRSRDGDGNGTATPDIGAVEAGLVFVTNTSDADPGSLRAALSEAAAQPGPDTVHFTAAVTPHIGLTSEIVITDAGGVTIDASDRPTGIVIDGGTGTNRHFRIDAGTTAIFQRLRLYGGGGTGGGTPANYGGSIYNSGSLTLRECTLADNTSSNAAGAVYNQSGALTVERSTFYGNISGGSGAILHESQTPMIITASTFTGNIGRFEGGAITLGGFRPATLTHCTISGNAVTQTGGNGSGGIRAGNPGNAASNLLTLRDSIVAGNTDANLPGVPNVNPGFINPAGSVNVTTGDAKLAPLGDYGGPTWTMPPIFGSAAIDAATSSTAQTDQRGATRLVDGNFDLNNFSDLGAVESPAPLLVNTTLDENDAPTPTLSLREAIRDAAAGASIFFHTGVFDGGPNDTITLGAQIIFTKGLIIYGADIPGGVTIDGGPGTNRIFQLPPGTGAYLNRLNLTGGNGGGGGPSGDSGGAIDGTLATLALSDCVLTGNTSPDYGGAISYYDSQLTMDRCLLTGNSASNFGGAISSHASDLTGPATSTTTLTNCTLTNNISAVRGGGMDHDNGRATLRHCTITGNTAPAGLGSGVFSIGDTKARTTVQNCLIVGNANASDVSSGPPNTFLSLGGNLIGSGNGNPAFNQTRDFTTHTAASLRLAPLADYGGPTHTIALRPGSPALGNAVANVNLIPITTDQRGFPAVGLKDSGAYEAGNNLLTSYNSWIWETLPNTATAPQAAATFDFDGDGTTNQLEWLTQTDAANPSSAFRPAVSVSGTDFNITFPTVQGRTYQLQASPNLANPWSSLGSPAAGTGGNVTLGADMTGFERYFFRVSVQ